MENNRFQCNAATFMLLTLLLSFAVQGCYKEEFPGNPTVALVVKTLNNPFFNDMQDGAEEMARKLELNLILAVRRYTREPLRGRYSSCPGWQ